MSDLRLDHLLDYVADHLENGVNVPSCNQIAIVFGGTVDAWSVWVGLRELQATGLIAGVPDTVRGWTHFIRVTSAGMKASGRGGVDVAQVRWRCESCSAVTIDPSKPCAICPLLARPLYAGFGLGFPFTETGYEALNQSGHELANERRVGVG